MTEAFERMPISHQPRVAAIVPCYNEEIAVGRVVSDLRRHVPGITVYVYDNNSTDRTAAVARAAGAIVRTEQRKGKGNVVRRAFADVEADVYLLIDGDDTYDASAAPQLINTLIEGHYDHVLGVRREIEGADAYRQGHAAGNRALNRIVEVIFGDTTEDMLSGYRVMSRRFVKSFPAVSREFEIETELTVHCLALRIPTTSVQTDFKDRPEGSESKLRTYRDGSRILRVIASLTRHERPVLFYGLVATLLMLLSLVASIPIVGTYFETGQVPRFPTLVVATTTALMAGLCMLAGFILDGIRKARHEVSRLNYLHGAPVAPHGDVLLYPVDDDIEPLHVDHDTTAARIAIPRTGLVHDEARR